MNRIYNEIYVGASEPFRVIHISDIHLTYADERDSVEIQALAKKRNSGKRNNLKVLEAASERAARENLPVICTGDFMDFCSSLNLEKAEEFIRKTNCFCMAGNHDYRMGGGMKFDNNANMEVNRGRVDKAFGIDTCFDSFIMNGVNFVAVNNVYYTFSPEQYERLREEVKKGLPVILLMHVPLYAPDAFAMRCRVRNSNMGYMIDVPEELLSAYPPERYIQQKPDEITREITEYIKREPAVKAILTGHIHNTFDSQVTDTLKQYITGIGDIRTVKII